MKIYVTMRFDNNTMSEGVPVAAYRNEAQAKAAIEKAEKAKMEFNKLYERHLKPYSTGYMSSSSQRSEEHNFPSKNGMFYATMAQAAHANRVVEFYDRPEVKDCQKRNTGESYFVTLELHG